MQTDGTERFIEPEHRTCFGCHDTFRKEQMEPIDISRGDEYYPVIRYLCWHCSRDTETESGRDV